MCLELEWENINNQAYYQPLNVENQFQDHMGYEVSGYNIKHNQPYTMNPAMGPVNTRNSFNHNQGSDHLNNALFRNNSISSIENINNFSYSEESDMLDGFNRTQSVRLYPNNLSGAITSRQNSSYESGVLDEEIRQTPRSYLSSGSHGSNPNYGSTCARTFASSGGLGDQNNSQMHLTYDIQQMHSSFDLGNEPLCGSYLLGPGHMSDFGYHSNQFSFPNYTKSQGGPYCTISNGSMRQMRN